MTTKTRTKISTTKNDLPPTSKHASVAGMSSIRKQYENWVYPLPLQDLDNAFKAGHLDLSDPSLFRRKLWPRPLEPENLKILIAGCGTSQAAWTAYRNPGCEVVGVDISQSSLAHQESLKQRHGLANLHLHCLNILDIDQLDEQFDFIVSTGVLHHLPDPEAGLRKLKSVLLPHGVMSIMLYGWYRRFGVYMMQEAFRLLGVEQTTAGVALVRETLDAVPPWHHVKSYFKTAPDVNFDGGIVDTFLHPSDRAYTVKQALQLVSDSGLQFQDWLDRHDYSVAGLIPDTLAIYQPAMRLALPERWQLVELLGQSLGSHRFLLTHPERNPQDYTVDFSTQDGHDPWLTYIPHLRLPIEVLRPSDPQHITPATLRRFVHEFTLAGPETRMFEMVNGETSIEQIIKACSANAEQLEGNRKIARSLFARMFEWDHLLFQI